VLGGAALDEILNVIVGLKSSDWDVVEGEIVGEPTIAYAGAMIPRREVGVPYKYYVEEEDDDDDDDDGDDDEDGDEEPGWHTENSLYSTPRKGLMSGLVDFIREPATDGAFGQELKELYPVGSKVKVYYNSEAPDRACLIPGLVVPNGPFRLPAYLFGIPFLIGIARSSMAMPIRVAYFSIASLMWGEFSEESEEIIFKTSPSLAKQVAKPIRFHPPILKD